MRRVSIFRRETYWREFRTLPYRVMSRCRPPCMNKASRYGGCHVGKQVQKQTVVKISSRKMRKEIVAKNRKQAHKVIDRTLKMVARKPVLGVNE